MAGTEQESYNGESLQQEWIKYLNQQGDWLEKTRGNLMVVATVIASMSFQVAMNPPGGVFQENGCPEPARNQTNLQGQTCREGGTTVLAYGDKRIPYIGLMISCTVSFSASLSIILLVISGLRLRNRLVMGMLVLLMVVAVLCMASTFAFSIILVGPKDDITDRVDSGSLYSILGCVSITHLVDSDTPLDLQALVFPSMLLQTPPTNPPALVSRLRQPIS